MRLRSAIKRGQVGAVLPAGAKTVAAAAAAAAAASAHYAAAAAAASARNAAP
jgi:hypothetical protein